MIFACSCEQCTSYLNFSHAVNTHSLLHVTLHGSRMCWCASSHPHSHPCHAPECCLLLDSLLLTLFFRVFFSYLFFFYLTGYEPNILDDVQYSETTEIFFQGPSGDAVPSFLIDTELSDETIGRALFSPLFIQEREEPADRRQVYHSFEESLLPSQSLSVCHARTGRPVHEFARFTQQRTTKSRLRK